MKQMYCKCGTEISIDSEWNGLVDRVVFTHEGAEIDRCPGCGESVTAWLEVKDDRLAYVKGALLDRAPAFD